MKRSFFLYFLFILSVKLHASSWKLNDDHSELFFSIGYLNVSEVTGRFKNLSGSTELDEKGVPRSLEIIIDASSLDTGHPMRDGHLRGGEFFQVKTHPFFRFTSNQIEKVDGRNFKAVGKLVIKNEIRSLTVSFGFTEEVLDTWGYKSRFVKFSSWLKRSDFKLNWNKTLLNNNFLVGDKVKFWGNLQIQPQQKMTPTSQHKIPDTLYIRSREKLARGELSHEYKISDLPPDSAINHLILASPPLKPSGKGGRFERLVYQPTITWWMALFTLGLMGFISMIIIGIHLKKILADFLSKKYTENGPLGQVVDFIAILIVIIYSVAFWIVGWGHSLNDSFYRF
jgi:polyisoprenoid-binding protein YceI